jgi:hypothetical protein
MFISLVLAIHFTFFIFFLFVVQYSFHIEDFDKFQEIQKPYDISVLIRLCALPHFYSKTKEMRQFLKFTLFCVVALKGKLYKPNAVIWYNKICREKQLSATTKIKKKMIKNK